MLADALMEAFAARCRKEAFVAVYTHRKEAFAVRRDAEILMV